MDNELLNLEKIILGACLLENSYCRVADILTHRNFSKPDFISGHFMDHQLIFSVFEKLYPLKPIDLQTVYHELSHEPGMRGYLGELTATVSSSANFSYYAFTLLEYKMRSSFIDLLHSKIASGAFATMTNAALQEIIAETLDSDGDILEIIEVTAAHLTNIYAEEPLIAAVVEFRNAVDKRIKKIQKQSSIESLLNNLANLSTVSSDLQTRLAINHLAELFKAIIAGGKIEPKLAIEIFGLKMR